mmetsp:Transcript_8672/g.24191  ORF Transcript_8672/g.24191 Transcript_8672/m.24191 type:complete len:208 (+) Transcript_8672:1805-2428(+)
MFATPNWSSQSAASARPKKKWSGHKMKIIGIPMSVMVSTQKELYSRSMAASSPAASVMSAWLSFKLYCRIPQVASLGTGADPVKMLFSYISGTRRRMKKNTNEKLNITEILTYSELAKASSSPRLFARTPTMSEPFLSGLPNNPLNDRNGSWSHPRLGFTWSPSPTPSPTAHPTWMKECSSTGTSCARESANTVDATNTEKFHASNI